MGKEGNRLKRCSASTSTSADVEAADHKGTKPLQKAERELQNSETDVNPKKLKKKSESNNFLSLYSNPIKESDYYEGERLTHLLGLIQRGIETSKLTNVSSLPEKIWLKKQIAIGINEVSLVLERMKPNTTDQLLKPPVQLQVIIVVADCKPRMLTKHIPDLAASRNVPVLFIRDNKRASLRLGDLVKLKTALAIGVKARGNDLNLMLQQILPRES